MNKIVLLDDNIDTSNLDSSISINYENKDSLLGVNNLVITILKNTNLTIDYMVTKNTKFNIEISVNDGINADLYEYKSGSDIKIRYHYSLLSNSSLNVFKLHDIDNIKEFVRIDLNGENAAINYNFKTISKVNEKYDLTIYHNSRNTNSNIINNGININDGVLSFNVSSFVSKGNTKCNVIQNSRIINLTDNKCQICPNLYIDEFDVNAAHSAHIGTFSYDQIFYLMSKGIYYNDAVYLLIRGFLMNNMGILSDIVNEICEKYWR